MGGRPILAFGVSLTVFGSTLHLTLYPFSWRLFCQRGPNAPTNVAVGPLRVLAQT